MTRIRAFGSEPLKFKFGVQVATAAAIVTIPWPGALQNAGTQRAAVYVHIVVQQT